MPVLKLILSLIRIINRSADQSLHGPIFLITVFTRDMVTLYVIIVHNVNDTLHLFLDISCNRRRKYWGFFCRLSEIKHQLNIKVKQFCSCGQNNAKETTLEL